MHLGYFVSPTKSTVVPTQRMVHLGFGIDSKTSTYFLTEKKRTKFRGLRDQLMSSKVATLKDIQRFVGKCNHLRLLFPASSLFTIRCRRLESSLLETPSPLPPAVVDEIAFWTFVDSCTDPIPFRLQQHLTLRLFTDASGYGWGAQADLPSGRVVFRDYWTTKLLGNDICVKEALAVLFALQSISTFLQSRRIDVFVDNEGLVKAWSGLSSKSIELSDVLQSLFLFCVDFNISLKMTWVSTHENPADAPSRALHRSDSLLAERLRKRLWSCYGPFSFDLLALPSNVFRDPSGGGPSLLLAFARSFVRGCERFRTVRAVGDAVCLSALRDHHSPYKPFYRMGKRERRCRFAVLPRSSSDVVGPSLTLHP